MRFISYRDRIIELFAEELSPSTYTRFYILIQFMQRYESQLLLSLFQLFPATFFSQNNFFSQLSEFCFAVQASEKSMKPSIRHIDFKRT